MQRAVPLFEASSEQAGQEGQVAQAPVREFKKVPALQRQTDSLSSQPAPVSHSVQASFPEQLTHPVNLVHDRQLFVAESKKLLAIQVLHTAWPGLEPFSAQDVQLKMESEHNVHLALSASDLSTNFPSSQIHFLSALSPLKPALHVLHSLAETHSVHPAKVSVHNLQTPSEPL